MNRVISSVFFALLPLLSFSQNDSLSLLRYPSMIDAFNRAYPQEKAYLHFDNTGYFIGETVRFKAYVVDCSLDSLSRLSSVLYVELVSPGGDVLDTRKIRLENGLGAGDIKLDNVLTSGFYEIRAYTRWMVNWGSEACFSRVFPVFRRPEKEGDYSRKIIDEKSGVWRLPDYRDTPKEPLFSSPVKVGFYPEGGRLIDGVETTVAVDITGKEFTDSIRGNVLSSDGDTLTTFVCGPDGRGLFRITPPSDGMRLVLSEGRRRGYELPASEPEGCALSVDAVSSPERIIGGITGTESYIGKTVGMNVLHGGYVVGSGIYRLGRRPSLFTLRRSDLPEGVSEIVVYDASGRILSNRMIFVIHEQSASDSISIVPSTSVLSPCGKVRLDITTRPDTELSLTACDVSTMCTGPSGGVRSWLLLSSDLRGYIPNADYYVESSDLPHRAASDLLMLVQGWRRYSWREMCGLDSFSVSQPQEDGLYLSGRVYPSKKRTTTDGVSLRAVLYDSLGYHLDGSQMLDSTGSYSFSLPDMNGPWTLIYNASKGSSDFGCRVSIDRHFSPPALPLSPEECTERALPEGNLRPVWRDADTVYHVDGKARLIPEVKVKGHRVYDNARAAWESESVGRRKAVLYYDCDSEVDRIADSGEEMPSFLSWLKGKNDLFEGEPFVNHSWSPEDTDERRPAHGFVELAVLKKIVPKEEYKRPETLDIGVFDSKYRVYIDGLSYKGRPIIWMIDNNYCCITGFMDFDPTHRQFTVANSVMLSEAVSIPEVLDEAKSVYISEDVYAYKEHINVLDLEVYRPVSVYVYTHHNSKFKAKGARRTYFQGYNVPETFKMEDYSVLPPMDDFRRTIFWAPSVKTDKNGRATVEFYNNSTCREMYISAECITDDGCALSN